MVDMGITPDQGENQKSPQIDEFPFLKLFAAIGVEVIGIGHNEREEPQWDDIEEVSFPEIFFVRIYHRRLSIKGDPKIPFGLKYRMSNRTAKANPSL